MHPAPILAVAETARVSVMDALPHLAGMLMVMVTLAILWGVCALTAKLIQMLMPERAPAPQSAKPPASATQIKPAAPERISPELVAVIAAAVASATGRTHRIISIKRQDTQWEKAGRQSVLTSHRIR